MTNERYLRSVLLGAVKPSSLASQAWPAVLSENRYQETEPFSVTSLEKLQQRASVFEIDYPARPLLRSTQIRVTYSLDDSLGRVSQEGQWQSLRANIVSRLEQAFQFRNKPRVILFLERYLFLLPLLIQTGDKVKEIFGVLTPIALEVVADPDNGKYEELWMRILTNLPASAGVPLLTRFDEEWWLNTSASAQDLMNVNLEFL